MKNILLTNKYSGLPLQIVQSAVPDGFVLRFLSEPTQDKLLRNIGYADYILAGGRLKITGEALDKAEKLRMIQRSGVGLDALDLEAIRRKGIPLYVNRGVNAQSVAEYALLMMLACLRKLPVIDRNTKNGVWKKQEQGIQTSELKGKTVGILGMGRIAKTLTGLLKPFCVKIFYSDPVRMPAEFEAENNMRYVGMEELLKESDIVTLHCALTSETRNLINADTISLMRDGAILINTARGEIIDPYAIADALRNGKLLYAALDVHWEEPIPSDYPLKNVDNVILTPHIAGVTSDSFRTMMHDAFRNISFFDKGELETIAPYRYL